MDIQKIETAVELILEAIGENPNREGLKATPRRIASMYEEIFSGLNRKAADVLNVFFEAESDAPVSVCGIPFYSMCEHHFLPFFGTVSVIYAPQNRKITGLSKIARLVDILARRPQIQENLTAQITEALNEKLNPKGVLTVVRAEHLCISMRGIKKPGTQTFTVAAKGIYETDSALRSEALSWLTVSE